MYINQYKIARYLVRKYPQWAYLPYKPMKEFMNPYIVKNKACDDIEDKFEENYKT